MFGLKPKALNRTAITLSLGESLLLANTSKFLRGVNISVVGNTGIAKSKAWAMDSLKD